ncbi:hypothetical protein PGT21_000713 [Puccinia graminis f. sp. tritici]|uniref:2-oxoisovalerate dehydrogenase subunit alpha n=1 Tax=Puccinia graminis f. sp. tritici TaxID=56615 RepID=A0A5B0QRC2_PUCGR|nr:hypothetical protein PGT21_000713 [Puccinia graminis f. sp. tritici]
MRARRVDRWPVHYASKKHHFHSISSPLATQIPQAAGAAYALKRMRQKGERPDDCVVCYLGEGAASEGDFHAGSTWPAFWAVQSFFSSDNSKGTGSPLVLLRSPSSGTRSRRSSSDGRGMTYRVGHHHSTSDDSSAYRNPNEVDQWRKRDNPINRMRAFLESKGWWDPAKEKIGSNSGRTISQNLLKGLKNIYLVKL